MARGSVTVSNENLGQGSFDDVERKALFIGLADNNIGSIVPLTPQSDLDVLFGESDSELKTNIKAAIINGGENWFSWALPMAEGYDPSEAVDFAMRSNVSPEFIAICTPVTSKQEIENAHAIAVGVTAVYSRRLSVILASSGIDTATQAWTDYSAIQNSLTDGVLADRVAVVPQLHSNNLGCYLGRLCNRAISISDSPLKTANGGIVGLGSVPIDVNGEELPESILIDLEKNRFTVPQHYPDFDGVYWADGNLLDAEGGDFQVIENLRVADFVGRRVRVLAIRVLGDREYNDTPDGIANTQRFLKRPLIEASQSVSIGERVIPSIMEPPSADAITVVWDNRTKMRVFVKAKPFNAPKEITIAISLDLTNGGAA